MAVFRPTVEWDVAKALGSRIQCAAESVWLRAKIRFRSYAHKDSMSPSSLFKSIAASNQQSWHRYYHHGGEPKTSS